MAEGKKRVAVLGGGCGSMAAVYGITGMPDWQKHYDITVYQLGWRIGGKGASGRNADHSERIEEHGLHVWAGFYENAFKVMRDCYAELGRKPNTPLATVWDAFKPHSFVTLQEQVGGEWIDWNLDIPTNSDLPGDGGVLPSVKDYLEMLLGLVSRYHAEHEDAHAEIEEATASADGEHTAVPDAVNRIVAWAHGVAIGAKKFVYRKLLDHARKVVEALPDDPEEHSVAHHHTIIWLLKEFLCWVGKSVDHLVENNDAARRLWIVSDLFIAHVVGILRDGVIPGGWDAIDRYEWAEWIERNGATALTLESSCVRGIYDYVFGFHKGDTGEPRISAGVAVHGLLRLCFTYKGAIFYEMQAGMGDTVFTPFYEVLKDRGVKFEFFNRVKNLGLSADGKSIETIDLGIQATLKSGADSYEPLREVRDLPCWPSHPLYDQLEQGDEIRDGDYDLESAWTAWKDVGSRTLTKGDADGFDIVVLGISLGALPYICPELIAARAEWREMVEKVETVQTLALQLWLSRTWTQLGWEKQRTIMTAYAQPFDTWADMSYLVEPREAWPPADTPVNLSYLCGPFEDAKVIPPFDDHGFPERERERVRKLAIEWLGKNIGHVWPDAGTANDPDGLDYDLLVDPAGGKGEARLDAQYIRGNVNPTERYVMSVPGSTTHRLEAGGSGFDNLYLAGDWVRTSISAGCVEAAVMAGLAASQALCGYPKEIIE